MLLRTSCRKALDEQRPALELLIVMPCLDEAETLEVCIRKAQEWERSRSPSTRFSMREPRS